jgi:hypothetical protein
VIKKPSEPRFQIFLDIVTMCSLLLAQSIYAGVITDFMDNYLCLLIAAKVGVSSLFMIISDTKNKSRFYESLFFFRFFLNVDIVAIGVVLHIYASLHRFCFILLIAIISSE